MNLILDTKPKMSIKRKILYISVIVICFISILIGVYLQVVKRESFFTKEKFTKLSEEEYVLMEYNFENIFTNSIKNNTNYKFDALNKINKTDDIVGIAYSNSSNKESEYFFNVNIPYININSFEIIKYNNKIENLFKKKALEILSNNNASNTVYTVDYVAYVNGNILSVVIRSTLKEGINNAQRIIMQSYNYDISTNRELSIDDVLDEKGITKAYAENEIKTKIKEKEEEVETLKKSGYSIYERNSSSDIYKIKNVENFFVGEKGRIYIVYAYGNQNYTSELDVVIL